MTSEEFADGIVLAVRKLAGLALRWTVKAALIAFGLWVLYLGGLFLVLSALD